MAQSSACSKKLPMTLPKKLAIMSITPFNQSNIVLINVTPSTDNKSKIDKTIINQLRLSQSISLFTVVHT